MRGDDNRRAAVRVARTLLKAKRIKETDRKATVTDDALFL